MSIWCSGQHIGTDPTVMYEAAPGMYEVDLGDGEQAHGRQPMPQKPERGNVISYADGFSNHYPDLTGSHERPAIIALAHIAPWCVPGHREDDEFRYEVGPWLRLEVVAPETLSFWTEDSDEPTVERRDASIILDEQAVRSLRDDLTAWLKRDKVRPA